MFKKANKQPLFKTARCQSKKFIIFTLHLTRLLPLIST